MCTEKVKDKKVNMHKNRQYYINQITEILSIYFLINETLENIYNYAKLFV